MAKDPIRPTDDEARTLARSLFQNTKYGSLGTLFDGEPLVTRIALAAQGATLLTLVSDLAPHTRALRTTPRASLLLGEPGKGDPLAHPRLTVQVTAHEADKSDTAAVYLAAQPKAQLYFGFADFHVFRLEPVRAFLNGGFGRAYHLTPGDLA